MMKCKNCGQTLSKLDKDICPFCGTRKPLEGMEDVTQDITKAFSPIQEQKQYKQKSKVVTCILGILFGAIGVPSFYLGKIKLGIFQIIMSIVLIAGLGSILYFTEIFKSPFAFLIPFFVVEGLMIIGSITVLFSNTIKDSKGEFLK